MFCSAIPTSIKRSGNSSRNSPKLLDPTESLQTTTIFGFSLAKAIKVLAKMARLSNSSNLSVLIVFLIAKVLDRIALQTELCGAILLCLP